MTDLEKWETEEDNKVWQYKGYVCAIRRNYLKTLCGYVIIPPTNKAINNQDIVDSINCHGGITLDKIKEINGNNYRLIGFDCCHFDDFIPGLHKLEAEVNIKLFGTSWFESTDKYRDIKYVTKEVEGMIDQLIPYETNDQHQLYIETALLLLDKWK